MIEMQSHRLLHLFLAISLPAVASACRTFWPPAHEGTEVDGVPLRVDYDASRRGAYFVPRPKTEGESSLYFLVTEPPPDVAIGIVAELAAKANVKEMNAEAQAKFTEQVIELGKRTQAVMVLREGLFRLQEGYANGVVTEAVYVTAFKQVVDASESIALAEIKDKDVAIKQAEANKSRADAAVIEAQTARELQSAQLREKAAPKQ